MVHVNIILVLQLVSTSQFLIFLYKLIQVFHEGLKSWSCCEDVNKPVLDFESFMRLPVRLHYCRNLRLF